MRYIFIGILFFHTPLAFSAAINIQPVDTVESTPITTFSDTTGVWPTSAYDNDLAQTSYISPFENLNRIPGIETRGSLSKGSPAITIRGSAAANRTLLLYDGIPLNLADGFGAQELLVPRESIGEVKVIKGPASVYYGASAMAGGINFVPEFYSRARIRLAGGGFTQAGQQKSAFGALPIMSDDRNQVVITANNDNNDGNYPYFSPVNGSRGTRSRTNTHTNRHTLNGNHNISGTKVGYRFLSAEEIGSTAGPITSIDPISYRKRANLSAVRAAKAWNRRWDSSVSTSHVWLGSRFFTESSKSVYESQASTLQTGFSTGYQGDDNLSVRLLYDNKQSDYKSSAVGSYNKHVTEHEPGILLNFPFSDDVALQSGARYLPLYGVVVKSLGLIQQRQNKKFWMTYSEGFRPPSLSDKYDYDAGSGYRGNPNLKPEESDQIELGASQEGNKLSSEFINRVSFEGSVFSTNYENLITYNDASTSKINKQVANAWGAEALAAYPLDLFAIQLGYSYLEASAKRTPLPYTTESKFLAILSHYFGPITFEIQGQYWMNYRRSSAPRDKTSFATTDFFIRTHSLTNWSFFAGLYNIFDRPIEFNSGYPEPRRRFLLSAEYIF